jgi:hypothetical protein
MTSPAIAFAISAHRRDGDFRVGRGDGHETCIGHEPVLDGLNTERCAHAIDGSRRVSAADGTIATVRNGLANLERARSIKRNAAEERDPVVRATTLQVSGGRRWRPAGGW